MTNRPEAVVFDVGRVIVRWEPVDFLRTLFDDPDEAQWFVDHVVTIDWHGQHDAGRAIAEMVAERQAIFPEYAKQIAAYDTRWLETIPGPVPGTIELIERLNALGVPLYAITNFGADFWARFRPTQPVFGRFRDIVVSGEEKLLKPGSAIFDLAEKRFGHRRESMLFIDDNEHNIAAARRLGWQVHHFTDAASLESALVEAGLLPE
ncbi:HAD-IA family hydrolase [Qipengyuania sp. JC766]|uniref:HAD-IA family hydrolase n=1 Tax=Qipengyuania sp. JC766 TaxID=3232139 RepID=UPI003459196F